MASWSASGSEADLGAGAAPAPLLDKSNSAAGWHELIGKLATDLPSKLMLAHKLTDSAARTIAHGRRRH